MTFLLCQPFCRILSSGGLLLGMEHGGSIPLIFGGNRGRLLLVLLHDEITG